VPPTHTAPEDLDLLHFGVATGRRGWVQTEDVINTLEPERLLRWLEDRG
jgi:DNA polymerase (family 10)